jgi:hypothetical protein
MNQTESQKLLLKIEKNRTIRFDKPDYLVSSILEAVRALSTLMRKPFLWPSDVWTTEREESL